jgi:hypothetical protein
MDGKTDQLSETGLEPDHIIGCFTITPTIVQDCVAAKVPVWFIRDIEKLPSDINVLSTTVAKGPGKFNIVTSDWDPPFPVVYRGPASVCAKHLAMHNYTRTWMVYRDPFKDSEDDASTDDRFLRPSTSYMSRTIPMEILEAPKKLAERHNSRPAPNESPAEERTVGPSRHPRVRVQQPKPCEY